MDLKRQKQEVAEKFLRIAGLIERNNLDGLALSRQNNFSWATGGSLNWVSTASEQGAATLLFIKDGTRFAILPNIEAPRFGDEENLRELGFEIVTFPWWKGEERDKKLLDITGSNGKNLGTDWQLPDGLGQEMGELIAEERFNLTAEECDRYREVGALTAEALESTVSNLHPGESEWEISGKLAEAIYRRGLVPFVTLVAVDERIYKYRHPIPTTKKLEKYAMVVVCAKKGGLVASCTRLIHFGPLSKELKEKQAAVQRIDAVFNLSTRPGTPVRDIFTRAIQEYARTGFTDEWQLHHQGGGTGYESRDFLGTPTASQLVKDRQAFAWNPSITGIKTEDTILVTSGKGPEIITRYANSTWPLEEIEIEGLGSMRRPSILVI